LRVEAPGYEPHVETVELEAGDQRELTVELTRVGYGIVRIDANVQEVWVIVDCLPVGPSKRGDKPLEIELPSGEHTVHVTADGHKDLKTVFEVPRGQVLPLRAHMIPKYPRGTAWTQAAIATVLLGTGTYLGLQSNRLYDELE